MMKLLAFDYGASSGRAILGTYNGDKLDLKEVHRFSNDPVMVNGTFYWDVLRLFHEMKQGIIKCVKQGNGDLAGMGTDTWGVDFGILDSNGDLLGNPVHYRDARTVDIIEKVCSLIPGREIYEQTGTAFQVFNTLYQLFSLTLSNKTLFSRISKILFMPDLLNYFLTGSMATEYTIASTSQMLKADGGWADGILRRLGIPTDIFAEIIDSGTVVGNVKNDICEELNINSVPVIAVAEHDTASAVVSVPAACPSYAYLSSGTWSLLGMELDNPVINDTTYELNYTNEGGFGRKTRLLKNIMGLWIYQECVRAWNKASEALSFDEMEEKALKEKPFNMLIDPDNEIFYSPGHMPDKIVKFLKDSGQKVPENKFQVVRCIMESLALKYRMSLEGLEEIVGYDIPVLHVVGGGCKNLMLNQFTADSIGKPVVTGPIEATSTGNLLCQLIALGELTDLTQARELVKHSFPTREYTPKDMEKWDEAYEKFKKL